MTRKQRHDSTETLVSCSQKSRRTGATKVQIGDFRPISRYTVQDRDTVTMEG